MALWSQLESDFLQTTLDQIEKPLQPLIGDRKKFSNFEASFVDQGILKFVPEQSKSENILILSAAVHGNETAPLELLNQWCHLILTEQLKLSVPVLFIIGNPVAITLGKRFKELNLNRLFSSEHKIDPNAQKTNQLDYETIRAQRIMNAVDQFLTENSNTQCFHFDLHTAIRKSHHEKFLVIPYFDNGQEPDSRMLQFWSNCGLTAALQSNAPAATFSYYTQSQHQAISATVELGQVAALGKNDLKKLELVEQSITAWIRTGNWPVQNQLPEMRVFRVKQEILNTSANFKLNISEDLPNFSTFKKGYRLAEDADKDYCYAIESEDDVIVFPNTKVPVGQRAALIAC